jgi:hypothetical protein
LLGITSIAMASMGAWVVMAQTPPGTAPVVAAPVPSAPQAGVPPVQGNVNAAPSVPETATLPAASGAAAPVQGDTTALPATPDAANPAPVDLPPDNAIADAAAAAQQPVNPDTMLDLQPAVSSDGTLLYVDAADNWHVSVMFPANEARRFERYQEEKKRGKANTLLGNNPQGNAPGQPAEEAPPPPPMPTEAPAFYMSTIIYKNDGLWAAWLQGKKFTPDDREDVDSGVKILDVTQQRATFEWVVDGLDVIAPNWEEKTKNSKQVKVKEDKRTVLFTLYPNQSFVSRAMKVIEGRAESTPLGEGTEGGKTTAAKGLPPAKPGDGRFDTQDRPVQGADAAPAAPPATGGADAAAIPPASLPGDQPPQGAATEGASPGIVSNNPPAAEVGTPPTSPPAPQAPVIPPVNDRTDGIGNSEAPPVTAAPTPAATNTPLIAAPPVTEPAPIPADAAAPATP